MRYIIGGLIGIVAAGAQAGPYVLDDGTSESSSGFNVDGNVAWLQTFQVDQGMDTITSIELAFGSPNRTQLPDSPFETTPLFGGESFKVFVWSGVPNGAYTLLAQTTASVDVGSVDTDVLQQVPINAVIPGGDGAQFFIGASIDIAGYGWPASFDRAEVQPGGNDQGAAWLTGTFSLGDFDPDNISGGLPGFPLQISQLIADGQWLMRANAVPEPGSAALLGVLSLTALCRRRAR